MAPQTPVGIEGAHIKSSGLERGWKGEEMKLEVGRVGVEKLGGEGAVNTVKVNCIRVGNSQRINANINVYV